LTAAGAASYADDYEAGDNAQTIIVTADDGKGLTTDITVNLNESNVNDNAPVFTDPSDVPVSSYTFDYAENTTASTTLGTVKATDADADTVTYTIKTNEVDGSGNPIYQIDPTTGAISLTAAGAASYADDYEAGDNAQTIIVTADDGKGLTTDITVNLNESNVNDNAPTLSLTTKSYEITANMEGLTSSGYKDVAVSGLHLDPAWKTDNVLVNGVSTVEIGQLATYGIHSNDANNNYVLELEQNPGDKGNLYTELDVKKGEVYSLQFDYAERGGDHSSFSVFWNGVLVTTITPTSTSLQTINFTLTSDITGTGKLEFIAGDSSSIGAVIDNIDFKLLNNTGEAGNITYLPVIDVTLTDSSESLSLQFSGLSSGLILTDGLHSVVSNGSDIEIDSSWNFATLGVIAPNSISSETVDLSISAISTAGTDTAVSTAQNVTLTINAGQEGVIGTQSNETLNGDSANNTLWGLDGNDILNGGAGNDFLNGGVGNDVLHGDEGDDTLIFDAADSVIDGGAGTDSLILLSGTSIDFSALDSSKISNIETINLSQNGDHTLTNLSYADVINMTDSNHTLTILGDSANDKVQLTQADGWSNNGTVTESGHTFDVYTSNGASATDPTVTVKVETVITDTVI
jgi:hypothetical protein